jgi:hypothetical protein
MQYQYTDESGKFSLYTEAATSYKIKFEDINLDQNGIFVEKDTVLKKLIEQSI